MELYIHKIKRLEIAKKLEKQLNIKHLRIDSDIRGNYIDVRYETENKRTTYKAHYFIALGNRKGYKNNTKKVYNYFLDSVSNIAGFGCQSWDCDNGIEKPLSTVEKVIIKEIKEAFKQLNTN